MSSLCGHGRAGRPFYVSVFFIFLGELLLWGLFGVEWFSEGHVLYKALFLYKALWALLLS